VGAGRIEVVATPIGNLGDLSARARDSLAGADVIAAEDTRRTLVLLQAIGVTKPLVSLHAHNETARVPELLERVWGGAVLVLVSDAGTPLLSDPGYELVRRASDAGFTVTAVPGPSAITTALAVAGLPTAGSSSRARRAPWCCSRRRTVSPRACRISRAHSAARAARL
jgi:16S rRNA (cytidine1402-2'-O)-methyltransferase